MSFVRRWCLLVGFAAIFAMVLLPATAALGEDDPATQETPETDKPSEADPFVVPEGGPKELVAYLKDLQDLAPNPRTDRRGYIQHLIKSAKPTWEAADKILAAEKATKKQKTIAARAKFGALGVLSSLGDPQAVTAMKDFPEELTKLGLDDLARMAKSQMLAMELRKSVMKRPDAAALDTVLAEIKQWVAEKPDARGFQLALQAVSALQMTDDTDKAAALCDDFAKMYSESKSKGAKDLVEKFEGIGRRLKLVGNPMTVEGTLLDGQPFDWSDYKGKVVLVQFWATWCGPCVGEIPNIEKVYDAYHDRGFDVVAISLDRDREALNAFLDKNKLAWPVLYKEGERNPTADYYGVVAIPTLILVGTDGNVVSLNARGPKLDEELEKLLGPVEQEKADAESKAEKLDGDNEPKA